MKLFKVEYTRSMVMYVSAEDEDHADELTLENADEWLDSGGIPEIFEDTIVTPVDDILDIDPMWMKALPFGENEKELTCQQVVELQAAEVEP